MALENTILSPDGNEKDLKVYNAHPLIDYPIEFIYEDDETGYAFTGFSSAFFRVYDSRQMKRIKNFTNQVSRNSNFLVLNCSVTDMTFSNRGRYYYEIGYVRSGGYDIVLQFGELQVI